MSHLVEGAVIEGLDFANFEDVLGLGHSKGFTSLLIPGLKDIQAKYPAETEWKMIGLKMFS